MKWKKFDFAMCERMLIIIKKANMVNTTDENNQVEENYIIGNVYKKLPVLTIQNLMLK